MESWGFGQLSAARRKNIDRASPASLLGNSRPQKRTVRRQYGHISPFIYDFPHFRAGRCTQDIPASYLQVDRIEDSRSAADTQLAKAGLSFEAAVGSFYSTADSIALPKRIGVFLPATAGKAALLGSVVQAITSAAFLNGAFINKLTLAAHKHGHNGFCLAGFSVGHR